MNISNTHRELFRSCEILFGSELHVCHEFLDYLEVSGVKSAFRKRAMETHPDLHAGRDVRLRKEKAELFHTVREAYENLLGFLQEKEISRRKPETHNATTPWHNKANSVHANHHNRRQPDPPLYQPIKPIILTDDIPRSTRFSNTENYYQGTLPHRQLLFGHFLYYSGLANWRTITRILTWQRTERPRLGELGLRCGIFDQEDIHTIMHYKKPLSPFGQTARMLGLLSDHQLKVLIFQQQRLQKKFGVILLEKNLLKDYELQELLYQFECHNENILTQGRQ